MDDFLIRQKSNALSYWIQRLENLKKYDLRIPVVKGKITRLKKELEELRNG